MTPSQIAEQLAERVEDVVRDLLPGGRRVGHEWVAGDVTGGAGDSLKVRLTGQGAGKWKDFASSAKGGDLIDLWAQAKGLPLGEAIKDVRKYLGIVEPRFEGARQKVYQKPERPPNLLAASKVDGGFLESRGVLRAADAYKVKVSNGALVFPYLTPDGVTAHLKFRALREKKFWSSPGTRPTLFGWQAIPKDARAVVITEGELDAMSMWCYGFPALSVPFGTGTGAKLDWVAEEWDNLERFDDIYVAFDQDDAGQAGMLALVDRLGRHRCRVISLPMKDANACLMAGVTPDAMIKLVRDAVTLDPVELKSAVQYVDDVITEFYPPTNAPIGFMAPWERFGQKFQFRYGECTILAGANGHGKSEGAGHIALEAMAQNVRTCVASLEFKPRKWLARLARQALCSFTPTEVDLRRLHEWYADKLWVFDVTGRIDYKRVLQVFEYAYRRYGIRLFVLDNMSKLGMGEDDYNGQKEFTEALTSFTMSHDVHVLCIAHMRKSESSHDDKPGGKNSVKGSGAITDLVDNVLIWWRNKAKEDMLNQLSFPPRMDSEMSPEEHEAKKREWQEKPDAIVRCEKQRGGTGEEPMQFLHFDRESHQFIAKRDERPRKYL